MNMIIHEPMAQEDEKKLGRHIAKLHAQLVFDYLRRQGYTADEKAEILSILKEQKNEPSGPAHGPGKTPY